MKKHTPKLLLLLLMVFLWFIPSRAQIQITTADSVIFWLDTHVNGYANDWDYVIAYLYKNQALQDSTVLALIDSGTAKVHYSGSHDPIAKGVYTVDYHAWLDDSVTKTAEELSVIDPDDFKYGGGACSPPTGTHTVTLLIADSEDTSAISQCLVQVWNQQGTVMEWYEYTVSNGITSFLFDTDTLLVKCYKPHYSFTIPESVFITDDITDTLYGSTSQIFPPQANLCRVYGFVYGLTGEADTTITVKIENVTHDVNENTTELTVPLRYEDAIISPFVKYTAPDDTGCFCFDVYRTVSLTPDSTYYRLTATDTQGNELLSRATGELGILFQAPDTTEYWIKW